MRIIGELVEGDVCTTEDTQFNRLNARSVIVNENITVRIFGIIQKELILRPGAKIHFYGRLLGNVINEGGEITFYTEE